MAMGRIRGRPGKAILAMAWIPAAILSPNSTASDAKRTFNFQGSLVYSDMRGIQSMVLPLQTVAMRAGMNQCSERG